MPRHAASTSVSTHDLFSDATSFPITNPTEPPPNHSRGSDSQIFVAQFIPPTTVKPRSGLRSRCQRTPKGIIRYLPDGTLWKCTECKTIYTPVRRSGSRGVATLCNACGLRRSKDLKKGSNKLRGAITKKGKKKPTASNMNFSMANKKKPAKKSAPSKLKTNEQRLHFATVSVHKFEGHRADEAKGSWKPVTNPKSPISLAQSNPVFGHRDIAAQQAREEEFDRTTARGYRRNHKQEALSCQGRQQKALSHNRQQQSPERQEVPQGFNKQPVRQHVNGQYQVPRQFKRAEVRPLQHQHTGHVQLRRQMDEDHRRHEGPESFQHQQMHHRLKPPQVSHCTQELSPVSHHLQRQREMPYHLSQQQMAHHLQPQSTPEHFDEQYLPQQQRQVYPVEQPQQTSPASTEWEKQDTTWTDSYTPISDYGRPSGFASDDALPVSEVLASMSSQSDAEEVQEDAMTPSNNRVGQTTSHAEMETPSEEFSGMQVEIQQCLQSVADNFGAQEENLQRLNEVQLDLLADRNINHAVADANREIAQLRALLNGNAQLMRHFAGMLPAASSSTCQNER